MKAAFPVFVSNLPTFTSRTKITRTFSVFGKIVSVRLRTNEGRQFMNIKEKNSCPFLTAWVFFNEQAAALAACEKLSGHKIAQNEIQVEVKQPDEDQEDGE